MSLPYLCWELAILKYDKLARHNASPVQVKFLEQLPVSQAPPPSSSGSSLPSPTDNDTCSGAGMPSSKALERQANVSHHEM